jgi:hypothetical protein
VGSDGDGLHGMECEDRVAGNHDIHCRIHFVNGQVAVNVFHCLSSCLHGVECLLIDVCSLDTIYLLLDLGDLVARLL